MKDRQVDENRNSRESGITAIGDVSWGTHLCHFYKEKNDLLDILVPYFRQGLQNNEFCMWVVSDPLTVDEAKNALCRENPGLDIDSGRMTVLSQDQWYTRGGNFRADRVLKAWTAQEKKARAKGFSGIRASGITAWVDKTNWDAFIDYEEKSNNIISSLKIIAVCSYPVSVRSAQEIIDASRVHQGTIIKKAGKWHTVGYGNTEKALIKSEARHDALLNIVSDMVFRMDRTGRFLEFRPSSPLLPFVDSSGFLGKRITDVLPKTVSSVTMIYMVRAIETRSTQYFKFEMPVGRAKRSYEVRMFAYEKTEVMAIVRDITEQKRMDRALLVKSKAAKKAPHRKSGFKNIIGISPGMQGVYDLIEKAGESDSTVLIQGESGTGKELVARAIHSAGPGQKEPFIPVDCSVINPSLIESELFGHVKGAFTGADRSRNGLLLVAGKGTIFLDEIGGIPLFIQPKLLRMLEQMEVKPVGSDSTNKIEARIIAATNKELNQCVKQGTFREDLFYRLNVIVINILPLRDRKDDIPLLVDHFIDFFATDRRNVKGISEDALKVLMEYPWPGNVRELSNCIERAFAVGSGETIEIDEVSNIISGTADMTRAVPDEASFALSGNEKEMIEKALESAKGNKRNAAKILKIGRSTLYRKMRKYGIKL